MSLEIERWRYWWLEDAPVWWPEWTERLAMVAACLIVGHLPVVDQCGRPEHDHCAWCRKSMPGRGLRRWR